MFGARAISSDSMSSEDSKAYIEDIRRTRFSIGDARPNPLAGDLHEAIKHLSAELYQKDIHFISELIQNAEDNSYAAGVEPELDLLLTSRDVAGVGAPATLLLYNNELGFKPSNIDALCKVGFSTKKGKRNAGYIGEKGIGFKSVFLVTSTPYIISNGFRIRFNDSFTKTAGSIGYIVPEWVRMPTDKELKRIQPGGEQWESRGTAIVLPLRPDLKFRSSVRNGLKELAPETLLFLRQIKRIKIRDEMGGTAGEGDLIIGRSDSHSLKLSPFHKAFSTELTLVRCASTAKTIERCTYVISEQVFPVTAFVEQRQEVKQWNISLAFPSKSRIGDGGRLGDVYAFLPSQLKSGLPFIINADFLLVSSRETLRFDSPWNLGILACIPEAFIRALHLLLQTSSDASSNYVVEHAYKYIPTNACWHIVFENMRQCILTKMEEEEIVLVDTDLVQQASSVRVFCKPCMARMVAIELRVVMEEADLPFLPHEPWNVVDRRVQSRYMNAMVALKVPFMSPREYVKILESSNWIKTLSEELYVKMLEFVTILNKKDIQRVPLVKYQNEYGECALATLDEISSKILAIYISPPEQGGWLSGWISKFNPWLTIRFMPHETAVAISSAARSWLKTTASVTNMGVEDFANMVLADENHIQDPGFIMTVVRYMHCSQKRGLLSSRLWPMDRLPVLDESTTLRKRSNFHQAILLPRKHSDWSHLLEYHYTSWNVIRMSDDYLDLDPDSPYPELGLEECRSFLKMTFGAKDLLDFMPPDAPLSLAHLKGFNREQSRLLLQWLSRIKSNTSIGFCNSLDLFWDSLKTTAWLRTKTHGFCRPANCFWPCVDFIQRFQLSDVPYVDEQYYGDLNLFRDTLEDLGVAFKAHTNTVSHGVITQIEALSQKDVHDMDLNLLTQLFQCLKGLGRKPTATDLPRIRVFVPACSTLGPSWKLLNECIIHDHDELFGEFIPVLEKFYPKDLLSYFSTVLSIPETASSDSYCLLWLRWRTESQIKGNLEIGLLWERIALNWSSCTDGVKTMFRADALVPTTVYGESQTCQIILSQPCNAFIPDDLGLRNLFISSVTRSQSSPPFVWYPKGSSSFEQKLNEVYLSLGARKLSDPGSVEVSFASPNFNQLGIASSKASIISLGLIIAVLGFIPNNISIQQRHAIIAPLCKVKVLEMRTPVVKRYSLGTETIGIEKQTMVLWNWDVNKLYVLRRDCKLLEDPCKMREFETQMAEVIASRILSDFPETAALLADLLKLLMGCEFEEEAVEYELRRKNRRIYEEDLEFLKHGAPCVGLNFQDFSPQHFSSLRIY